MNDIDDVMACLRAICEALVKSGAVTRAQIAEAAQEHLLNVTEGLPVSQKAAAYSRLRTIATSIQRLSDPSRRA